jgi:UDP-glucuronate 4-epimerase
VIEKIPKTVLITGVYGFIGFSVALRLLKEGAIVYGIDKVEDAISPKKPRIQALTKFPNFHFHDVNLTNFEQTRTLLSMLRFDHIIHLAGQYSVTYNTKNMLSFIDGNVRSYMHIMDCAQKKGINRVLYASSTYVTDNIPTSLYGATLEFRERAANVYSSTFGIETVGLRFGSTYGPYVRPDTGIYIIAKKLWEGEPINVESGGFNRKVSFLYIGDAVEVILRLLDSPLPRKYNIFTLIANDQPRDLGEILTLLEKYGGKEAKRIGAYSPEPSRDACRDKIDPLRAVINYVPQTPLEEGMKKFVEWFGKQKETVKLL